MPIYEYVCRDCGVRFERYVRSFGEAVLCPACLGDAIEKQLSSFAFSVAGRAPASAGGGCACGRGGCGCGR